MDPLGHTVLYDVKCLLDIRRYGPNCFFCVVVRVFVPNSSIKKFVGVEKTVRKAPSAREALQQMCARDTVGAVKRGGDIRMVCLNTVAGAF